MILVCGEALVDLFITDQPDGTLGTRAVLGGSPFNVAIALARLGEASAFCGGLSHDRFGRALSARLAAEKVDLAFAVPSERLTTISAVSTDETGHPSYAFHGEGKADRHVTTDDLPTSLPDSVDALTFGSYTIAVSPVADAYLSLARRERGRRLISIDPNVRPAVTPDMEIWRHRFALFLATADIVKASEEDIFLGYGQDADVSRVAESWLAAGAGLVFVTHGENGASAYRGGLPPMSVPGRAVKVVDTVGAGDTFHAAALARLSSRGRLTRVGITALTPGDLRDILAYAVTAASITCTRAGADVPTAREVDAVLR